MMIASKNDKHLLLSVLNAIALNTSSLLDTINTWKECEERKAIAESVLMVNFAISDICATYLELLKNEDDLKEIKNEVEMLTKPLKIQKNSSL